jgi:indolepyruvate ferredoxin oxidoreductase alpha subunit
VVAVIGDSTFYHSGMTGLLDVAYNKGAATVIILDNSSTAMTGSQENPGTGFTLSGEPTVKVDLEKLAGAMGIKRVRIVNPYRLKETEQVVREEAHAPEPSLIISRAPCVLLKRERRLSGVAAVVDEEACTGCKSCLAIGCPALEWRPDQDHLSEGRKRPGRVFINPLLCVGCEVCAQICRFGAIKG